jgi:hypothetical protein
MPFRFLIFLAAAMVGSLAFSQDRPLTKEQLVDQLYEVHGLGKMPFEAYVQWKATGGQFQQMATQFPQIRPDDWNTLFKRLYDADRPAMKKQFTTFMKARFDAAELAQINAFYASTAGKKLLASIPEVFAQSAQTRTDDIVRPVIHDWVTEMTKKYNLK